MKAKPFQRRDVCSPVSKTEENNCCACKLLCMNFCDAFSNYKRQTVANREISIFVIRNVRKNVTKVKQNTKKY